SSRFGTRRSRRKPPTIRGSRRCWIPRRGSRNALPSGSTTRTWISASRSITTSARRPRRSTAVPCTTPQSRGGVFGPVPLPDRLILVPAGTFHAGSALPFPHRPRQHLVRQGRLLAHHPAHGDRVHRGL